MECCRSDTDNRDTAKLKCFSIAPKSGGGKKVLKKVVPLKARVSFARKFFSDANKIVKFLHFKNVMYKLLDLLHHL